MTTYNANFKIALDKFVSTGLTLPSDLHLANYLRDIDIKDTYSDFAASWRLATRIKAPAMLGVMAELENKTQTPYDFIALLVQ